MAERDALAWAKQHEGLVTKQQAGGFNLRPHQLRQRVRKGKMERVMPSVFKAGGAPPSFISDVLAGVLWAEKESRTIPRSRIVVSHHSAARLHGFPSFSDVDIVHLTMDRLMWTRKLKVHIKRKKKFSLEEEETDARYDARFLVTTPARTLLDIANKTTFDTLADCVDHCLREKLATLEQLRHIVHRGYRQRGIKKLRAIVERRLGQPLSESKLEDKALRLIEKAKLPPPSQQVPVELGNKRYRLDLAYPEAGVVIECDGYAWHADVESFESDRERHNRITAAGGLLLRWTWNAIRTRPQELVKELAAALARNRDG